MESYGRRVIWSDAEEITAENVVSEFRNAYLTHLQNRSEIDRLYDYNRGKQDIRFREKEVRPEIKSIITENRFNAITSFKVGYLVGKPIQYICATADESTATEVLKLNDYMRSAGKITKDRELVEWLMIGGIGHRMVLPKKKKGERVSFNVYTLDPRNSFCVRVNDYTQRTLFGCTYKLPIVGANESMGEPIATIYTEDKVFTVEGGRLTSVKPNPIGMIPIIEYSANLERLGAAEVVLPLLDAVNELDSNRLDSVKQFVESLLVAYNCDFDEDVTANKIREAGMIALKSINGLNADIKVISETLNQTDNETLKSSLIQAINEIAGMPSQSNGNSTDSSNNGAIVLKNGWQGAETRAQEFEAMFVGSEREMLEVISRICASQGTLNFDPDELDVKFTRRQFEDILSKAQTLTTMLKSDYVHPRMAYEASGLFVDAEDAMRQGIEWHETHMKEGETNEPTEI